MIELPTLYTLALVSLLLNFSVGVQQCGQRPLSHLPLIYGGSDSIEGEWPWHAALYVLKRSDDTPSYQCGGTLISSSLVLTAAHCTTKYLIYIPVDRLIVRFGITNLNYVGSRFKDHQVQKIIRHEKYHAHNQNYHYDVALLKMAREVEFTDYIQPVCSTAGSTTNSFKFGYVVGWGFGDGNELKQHLQKAKLSFVDAPTCLSSNTALYSVLLSKDNSNFCAGSTNETIVCDGDSGGGMFVYNKPDKKWYIRGIINGGARVSSTMKTRCNTKQYVVFANVSYFTDWIDSKNNEKTTNLLDLDNCAEDDHDSTVPENEKAMFPQYPWVAIHEYASPNVTEPRTVCSGVLIHPQFVLSTAHCLCVTCDRAKLKSVRLGDFDLSSNPDTDPYGVSLSTQSVNVDKFIVHPKFTMMGYSHNIALIKLSQPVSSERMNIKPICLPKTSSSVVGDLSVVGWKRAGYEVLQREIIKMQTFSLCKKAYSLLNVNLDPEKSFVCVEHNVNSANDCYSFKTGSSLHYLETVDGSNRYYLKGIYAFGFSKCGLKQPDVFVNVNYYLSWIKKAVRIELGR